MGMGGFGMGMGPRQGQGEEIKQEIKDTNNEPDFEESTDPEKEKTYTVEITESERKFIAGVLRNKAQRMMNEPNLYFDRPRQMAIPQYNNLAKKFEDLANSAKE